MPPRQPKSNSSKKVEALNHTEDKRKNIPTAEYQSVMAEEEKSPIRVAYERRNRDLDPQLVWRGKDEQDWSDLVVSAPPLYIQEKVHPKVLVDDLRKQSQMRSEATEPQQLGLDLFADFNGLPKGATGTEFYQHDANWTNRMILGDSLQVMASLAEREGLRGKVQCIYIDPPYGIRFNSNFQWSTTSRDVKDGKVDQITREPEQVKAFRDTWRDGIHSYLTYLRDRLTVARDLLTDSGSIFVQIGSENVHRIRSLLDEIFGEENFVSIIQVQKTGSLSGNLLANTVDFIVWFTKSKEKAKYRQLYNQRLAGHVSSDRYDQIELTSGTERRLSRDELERRVELPEGKVFQHTTLISSGQASELQIFVFQGKSYRPPAGSHWKTTISGLENLAKAGRIAAGLTTSRYKRFLDDFSVLPITDRWESLQIGTSLIYVVQTSISVVERCILMATDPGDLVLDPTCVRRGTRVLSPPKSPRPRGDFEDSLRDFEANSGSLPVDGEGWGGGLFVPIEDLKPGDRVYSHDGQPHRILRTIAKSYRGQMMGLKHQQSQETLWLTADHLVLAKLRPRTLGGDRDWSASPYYNLQNRKRLRQDMTPPERKLWACLRGKQLGYKFRRQHPIGRYIADFYSRDANLVVEVDGATHFTPEAIEYDQERDQYIRHLGLDVLRFTAQEVETHLEGVSLAIRSHCQLRTQSIEDARWIQAGALQPGDVVFTICPPLNPSVDGGTSEPIPAPFPWTGSTSDPVPFPSTRRVGEGETLIIGKGVILTEVQTEYSEETVYDLEVEDAHSFVTEVCIVHNCGSGTTAYVAEQWGRRWIAIDTSRVALALARARIMGARYPYYLLTDSPEGRKKEAEITRTLPATTPTFRDIRQGFVYDRVPHITLKAIANNTEIDVIWEKFQEKLERLRQQLNTELGKTWEEWEIPREAEEKWSESAKELHSQWWKHRIARQKEIDGSIAAKADQEFLYDKPFKGKSIVRVAGPFTVESLSPYRVLAVNEDDELIDPSKTPDHATETDFASVILENLKTSGVQQAHKEDKITFTTVTGWAGKYICAEGRYLEGDSENPREKRAGIFIGSEFGTVSRPDLVAATREAGDAGFDVPIACAFSFDAHSADFTKLGRIPVLKARMNADLHMADDLKNTGSGNLFVIFGQPDIEIQDMGKQIQVKINGVDVFRPQSGEVVSSGADGIACWFIDTDYNEESFFVRHAYLLGANDPYKSLKTTLKAEIDEAAWESLYSDTSRPFDKPKTGRIAVKVINHLGDEVMKVFSVE